MINFIKKAVESVEGIKSFLFNTDYRNNFSLGNVDYPCCVLTPIMNTKYDLNNFIHESAELQISIIDTAPSEYTGDDLYSINKRCSDLLLQVIANLQVKAKFNKEVTFEFILPSGDELVSGVMCNITATMKQGSCIGAPSYVEVVVQPIVRKSITTNGTYHITPSSGFNAMREVEVDVNVDLKGSFQDKQVTITENGTQIITADEGFDGLSSVEVNSEVYEGFDFSNRGMKDFSDRVNRYFLEDIDKKIISTINMPANGQLKYRFQGDLNIIAIDLSKYQPTNIQALCYECYNLKYAKLNTDKCTNFNSPFRYCWSIEYIELTSIAGNTEVYSGAIPHIFWRCDLLKEVYFTKWKKYNIKLNESMQLKPKSIHYIIQNAMSVADGATARSLTLHATAKANWKTSEYYEQDLAVLTDKGITIA